MIFSDTVVSGNGVEEVGFSLHEDGVQCPSCWQWTPVLVDILAGAQDYIDECGICCRPLLLRVQFEPGGEPAILAEAAE